MQIWKVAVRPSYIKDARFLKVNEPHTFKRKCVFCRHKILWFLKIITVNYDYFATNRQSPACRMN